MASQSKAALNPTLQVWVTGVALVIGFFCGLIVTYVGIKPLMSTLRDSTVDIHQSTEQLDRFRRLESYDREVIRALAQAQPELYRQTIAAYPAEVRDHFDQIAAGPAKPVAQPNP